MSQADTPGEPQPGVPARWQPAGAWVPQPPSAGPVPRPTDWRRHLAAVLRYRWLIVGVTVLGTALGFGLTRIIRPKYRAEATVWIQATQPRDAPDRGPVGSTQLLNSYSWVDLLKSYTVLDDVVRQLHLYLAEPDGQHAAALDDFAVRPSFQPGSYRLDVDETGRGYVLREDQRGVVDRGTAGDSIGRTLGFAWAPPAAALAAGQSVVFTLRTPRDVARELADQLDIRLDPGGTFLRLALDGREPQQITAVVNAIARRYVSVAAQLKLEKVTGSSQVLADQVDSAQQQVQTAEAALQQFEQAAVTQPGTADGESEDPRVKSYLDLDVQR